MIDIESATIVCYSVNFDRAFDFSGKEICRLMRKHKVTIKMLSRRMKITMWRIRLVRSAGVCGHCACEFYEAITGSLSPRMRAAYRQRMLLGEYIHPRHGTLIRQDVVAVG
jgi:hypothetical protein